MKIGILDIGTNSIHLILVEIHKSLGIRVIDRAKEVTRLGETSFQEGTLSEPTMHRGLLTLRRFKKLADIHGVSKIKAVATSAVREAANGGDFLERIEKETGINVDVITGEEEARLIYLAVCHSITLTKKPVLIMDIGGGSVEAVIANQEGIRFNGSFKIGVLRLKGDFIRHDPPSKKELKKMEDHIHQVLKPVLKKSHDLGVETLIGTSGTLINLAAMAHGLVHTTPIEIQNNFRIKTNSLLDLHQLLIKSNTRGRLKIRAVDPTRVDTLIPGSAVLKEIVTRGNFKELNLCDEAIREGLVYDFMEKNRSKIEMEVTIPNLRLRSVLQLAKKCGFSEKHAHHVKKLTLSLFDQTHAFHHFDSQERELLEYSSILHDIGYHIHYKKHHKHSYYLIKHGDLNGFSEEEIEMIASIACYHCKLPPKPKNSSQKKVRVLAALLKLADGLDRSHFSVVEKIRLHSHGKSTSRRPTRGEPTRGEPTSGQSMVLDLYPVSDPELEIWAANRKKDLFEEVFGKKLVFKVRR